MYELQYEEFILGQSEHLFSDYICSPFKKLLTSPIGDSQADLILVEKEYRRSYVVEVELSTHSLEEHVLPQMERLVSARIGDAEAVWISDRDPRIDQERLNLLFTATAPEMLVVVNAPVGWRPALTAQGVLLLAASIYIDSHDDLIISMEGDEPEVSSPLLTSVTPGRDWFASMLRIDSPATLATGDGESVEVLFEGHILTMRVRHIAGAVYLKSGGGTSSLLQQGTMNLVRRSDGWLELVGQG